MKEPAVPQPPSDTARFSPSAGVPAMQVTGVGAGASPHSPHREFRHPEATGYLLMLPCQEGMGRARAKVKFVYQRETRQVDTWSWS